MKFQVRVLKPAERDVREIIHWISGRSKSGAVAWRRAYQQVVARLSEHADTYALAAESGDFDFEIREIVFRTRRGLPYRAVFTVAESEVQILRIRGPGQDHLTPDDLMDD